LVLGALFAVLIAAAFLAGERLFPTPSARSDGRGRRRQRGERLRREEIGYYLDAIGESYEADATVDGHEVAFFLPDRDVVVTFDARAYLSLEDSGRFAILVEHEMPGGAIGNRLPFETPDLGPESGGRDAAGQGSAFRDLGARRGRRPGAGGRRADGGSGGRGASAVGGGGGAEDREAVRASFAALGLPPDASTEEVRAAYRARVKEVHPDHGGDERSFKRIQEAYSTAKEHAD
jgi:hypothetical protein